MFARLRGAVVGKPKEDLLVPAVALGYDQQGNYVLVVDQNNIVQRRNIKLGIAVGDSRVVQEGLTATDWVITSGLLRAIPGKPVIPVTSRLIRANIFSCTLKTRVSSPEREALGYILL